MDGAVVCELLQALQNPDSNIRSAGESKLEEAREGSPNELVQALCGVLSQKDAPMELRQEAAVLLRQCVAGVGAKAPVWSELGQPTQAGLKAQLLMTVEQDSSNPVRKNAGNVIAAIAEIVGEDFDDLNQEWPELMPALSRFVGAGVEPATRVSALNILKDLAAMIGEGMIQKGGQATSAMLQTSLTDQVSEIRAAGAQLVFQLIEDLPPDTAAELAPAMPQALAVIQGFAVAPAQEGLLKETLESLISAIDEEPEFFCKQTSLEPLWKTMIELCGAQHFEDADIRHSAMEAATSLAAGLADDFCKAEGQPLLEQLIGMNVEWMLAVEEDVAAWTAKADADDDDELDGEPVEIGEENLDQLAERCADVKQLEEVFMPLLFKVIRAIMAQPEVSWKHVRACVMAVSQVVEHLEEEPWIDQCVEFIHQQLSHAHPRVRDAGFRAVGQVAYDHEPYVQENHHELLLPAICIGLEDENIRVAASACSAFTSLGEELDADDIMEYLDDLVTKMFTRLHQGQTRSMKEQCLSGIAVVAEVAEDLFIPYYGQVMPVLKQIIAMPAADDKAKVLRGKAFECVSLVGEAVGKETFLADAHEVMQAMMETVQVGFAGDDQSKEYIHEFAVRVALTLEKEFKPYVPMLLPGVMNTLSQRPQEVDPLSLPEDEDDDKEDMSLQLVGEKVMGLKTSVLKEMEDALSLILTLASALEEDYCEFLAPTCQGLLPLLDFGLSEDVRQKAFKTWEIMAECARNAAEKGRIDPSVVRELLTAFLKTTVESMMQLPEGDALNSSALGALQAQAIGVAGVVKKAGTGVLGKEEVGQLAGVIAQILGKVSMGKDDPVDGGKKKHQKKKRMDDDDDDDDESDFVEEGAATRQSVRFCLADVSGALMRTNPHEFAEVGLPGFMQGVQRLLQGEPSDEDRSLALYICSQVVASLGELSVPYWNSFMEKVLGFLTDKCAVVRQHAASCLGHASKLPIFGQMAPAAAQRLALIIQKQSERHRRRRAANKDAKEVAMAVDAAIGAFGLLCEHQEQRIGGDSVAAWRLWLNSLPLRCDQEEAQKVHLQLIELVVRKHPFLDAEEQMPKVLRIFAEVYETRFSNSEVNKKIATAVASAEEVSQQMAADFPEKQKKKVERMLKAGQIVAE